MDLKNLVANVGIDDDEVNDMDNEDAIHLNDGFGNLEDIVNDRVQHEHDNQQHHFGGPIENEGEQHDHFGGPDQENEIPDHNVKIDGDDIEDDDSNVINIIPDNLSCTDSDTREFFNTNEAPQSNADNTEDLSDKDDNDYADATPKSHYLTRNLKSDLGEF